MDNPKQSFKFSSVRLQGGHKNRPTWASLLVTNKQVQGILEGHSSFGWSSQAGDQIRNVIVFPPLWPFGWPKLAPLIDQSINEWLARVQVGASRSLKLELLQFVGRQSTATGGPFVSAVDAHPANSLSLPERGQNQFAQRAIKRKAAAHLAKTTSLLNHHRSFVLFSRDF